jgi:hypothetical protein
MRLAYRIVHGSHAMFVKLKRPLSGTLVFEVRRTSIAALSWAWLEGAGEILVTGRLALAPFVDEVATK